MQSPYQFAGGGSGAGGGVALSQASVQTSAYAATANQIVPCDISGGSFTVTLPNAPAAGALFSAGVVAVSGVGVNTVTLATAGSDVFDKAGGATTAPMTLLHQSLLYEYNSGVWAKVAGADPYLQVASNRLGVFYLDQYAGTDDQKMASALAAVFAAGGGTVTLSPRAHTFANQWATSYSSGVVTTVRIIGAGASPNGTLDFPGTGATSVTFTYNGAGAGQMDFQHIGLIEIAGIQFTDTSYSVPFFICTNATPYVHDNSFNGPGSGATCTKDALVFGGTGTTTGSGDTAKFNGYGGRATGNYFSSIRAICRFQTAANSVQVHDNAIAANCGYAGNFGAPFVFAAASSHPAYGNQVHDNLIEMVYYQAVAYAGLGAYAQQNLIGPNGVWDNAFYTSFYAADTTSQYNTVVDLGYSNSPEIYHRPVDPSQTGKYLAKNSSSVVPDVNEFIQAPLSRNLSYGYTAESQWGTRAAFVSVSPAANPVIGGAQILVNEATDVGDGKTITGTPFVTSATAAFSLNDIGAFIASTNGDVPQTTKIIWTYNATSPFGSSWTASTAVPLGQPAVPTTSNGHLYQCTTAGTTGSTQPTWPTGGGTVTDGTVVWTDLGSGATAALLSANAIATASALVLVWGRPGGTLLSMTSFINHHVIGSGTAPTWTATGAGSGYTATAAGHDLGQILTLVTGTGSSAGIVLTGTAGSALYSVTGAFSITAANAGAAALMTAAAGAPWIVINSTTGWTMTIPGTPADGTTYKFHILTLG